MLDAYQRSLPSEVVFAGAFQGIALSISAVTSFSTFSLTRPAGADKLHGP
jgi:hypothetical protein